MGVGSFWHVRSQKDFSVHTVWISLEKISWKPVLECFGSCTVENSYRVDVGYFVLACRELKAYGTFQYTQFGLV